MGGLVWGAWLAADAVFGSASAAAQLVSLAIPIGVGLVAYLGAASILGIEELDYARSLVGRRFSRR
jgi:hypothetical protein